MSLNLILIIRKERKKKQEKKEQLENSRAGFMKPTGNTRGSLSIKFTFTIDHFKIVFPTSLQLRSQQILLQETLAHPDNTTAAPSSDTSIIVIATLSFNS